jgi:hypothetical protein
MTISPYLAKPHNKHFNYREKMYRNNLELQKNSNKLCLNCYRQPTSNCFDQKASRHILAGGEREREQNSEGKYPL